MVKSVDWLNNRGVKIRFNNNTKLSCYITGHTIIKNDMGSFRVIRYYTIQ